MRTKIVSTLAALIMASTLMWGAEHIYASWFATAALVSAAEPLPDYVLYDSLFRMDLSFRRKALEQELTGQPVTSLKTYFKDRANLTDEENELLRQASIEFIQEIRPLDVRAQQITADIREQFLYGEVPPGQEVVPPPAELIDLQNRRNELVLRSRDKLADSMGKDTFAKFDEFMHKDFSSNFQLNGELPRR